MITGKKDIKCGLLGGKLSHSFSPRIHRHLADYSYALFEREEIEVGEFLKNRDFDAINVTIPHKKNVIPFLDSISEEAKRIGAVNTIVKGADGKLRGENTDYYGLSYTVKKSGIEIGGKNVLILGTGGASLTAKCVCEDMGAKSITFLSRSGEINYENVYETCAEAEVIINCTPVGMYPKNGASPVILEKFKLCRGVIDMIYNPARTQLLLDAERLGIPCINGLSMLVAQAKRACELFLDECIDDSCTEEIISAIESETENIVLVGMPGCGKTTVGSWLSDMTGRPLVDTDEKIEEACGKHPREIIKERGEAEFRLIESQILAELGQMSGAIISTGGGVVTQARNKDLLRQNGKVVFIHRAIGELDVSGRPLSLDLEKMYEIRLPLYCDFCDFEAENAESAEKCAKDILERLKG